MTMEEAQEILQEIKHYLTAGNPVWDVDEIAEACDMAIEALKAKCPTCKRCSDHQESETRCPIEEHYSLPKDGFCHLYEPYKEESEDKE